MVKSAVQVCVRTRPTSSFAHDSLKIDVAKSAISVHLPKNAQTVNNQLEDWNFRFDQVMHNANQEDVYDKCAADIVQSVLDGYNGTVMAYGQTGAGKTFTMTGATQNYKYRGVVPRAIAHIFREIAVHQETAWTMRISYLEVYNEGFYDLLQMEDGGKLKDLAVMDDAKGQVQVKGLSNIQAASEEEALNLLFEGETNRSIGPHIMNRNSSRSHTIFSIQLEQRSRVESSERVVSSKLNLVDLAGSERVNKTGSSGETLKEAQHINKSLSFLEQVVIALSDKTRDHIPFRQSKLTNVLRDSLGGNCKTRLIANIWAEQAQLEETISTLKFATRMMRISTDATQNVVLDPLLLLKKYERELKELKQELAMHDTLSNRGKISYEPYTTEQQAEMQQNAVRFLRGDLEEVEVVSLRQIKELFRQFRNCFQNIGTTTALNLSGGPNAPSSSSAAASSTIGGITTTVVSLHPPQTDEKDGYVGDIDESRGGFHIGNVPAGARPPTEQTGPDQDPQQFRLPAISPAKFVPVGGGKSAGTAGPSTGPGTSAGLNSSGPLPGIGLLPYTDSNGAGGPPLVNGEVPDEETAFEMFKSGGGADLNKTYLDNKTELKNKKDTLKALSVKVNDAKRGIDLVSDQLTAKRSAPSDPTLSATAVGVGVTADVDVIDEEEFALIQQLKKKKKEYQEAFQERKNVTSEISYLKGLVDHSKVTLCHQFLAWYKTIGGVDKGGFIGSVSSPMMTNGKSSSSSISPSAQSPGPFSSSQQQQDEDELDDGEQFDKLSKERILTEDPESLSYHNAKKNMNATLKRAKKKSGLAAKR